MWLKEVEADLLTSLMASNVIDAPSGGAKQEIGVLLTRQGIFFRGIYTAQIKAQDVCTHPPI
jgi:hypothetical protein